MRLDHRPARPCACSTCSRRNKEPDAVDLKQPLGEGRGNFLGSEARIVHHRLDGTTRARPAARIDLLDRQQKSRSAAFAQSWTSTAGLWKTARQRASFRWLSSINCHLSFIAPRPSTVIFNLNGEAYYLIEVIGKYKLPAVNSILSCKAHRLR